MNNRLSKLRNFLTEKNLDAVFITYPSNVFYFSGFRSLTYNEREAYVFVSQSQAYILTSKLYLDEVQKTLPETFTAKEISADSPLTKVLAGIMQQEKIQSVGFEEHNLTYHEYQKISQKIPHLIPTNIDHIRVAKDQEEIKNIAKACEIGDKTFAFILGKIKPGITEEAVAFEMEIFMRKQHAIPSFPSIVAFGPNASVPHHMAGTQQLEANSFVLLDFGVRVQNYCSDMTRTVFIGKPTSEQKKVYETVRIAQEKAIELLINNYSLKKDIIAKDVDTIAREYITAQGYPNFSHSLGHGIGIDVHEGIRISPFSETKLEKYMVFSIEPGIYITNEVGVRIEDLVALEENKVRLLTKAPKELIIL